MSLLLLSSKGKERVPIMFLICFVLHFDGNEFFECECNRVCMTDVYIYMD